MSGLSVLITCPPMLGMKHQFMPIFDEQNIRVGTPDVVQTVSEKELIEIVPEYDGWIIGDDPATENVFQAGKKGKLKAAVKWGIGVDNVDIDACKKLNIEFSNTPGMFGAEVGDIALGYVIALARETFLIDREVRIGKWKKLRGESLSNKNVGVIGFGDIGKNTAFRLNMIGMNVTVFDPFTNSTEFNGVNFASSDWPNGLESMDYIVFTCSLNDDNFHMFSTAEINRCKDGIRVVNVARGPLLDEQALVAGLESGKIYSAALDVFEQEPIQTSNPLLKYERCVFGSHNSSNTAEAVTTTNNRAIEILLGFLGTKL